MPEVQQTIPIFNEEQLHKIQRLLATKVVQMGGRKLEEGDWTEIYCSVLGIDNRGWSNLEIDVVSGNIGIEQKLYRVKSHADIASNCGTSLMHPALTRSFRLEADAGADPNEAMRSVFEQYAGLVESRKAYVRKTSGLSPDAAVEMRSGWLLWQESLRQFLYFEEPMKVPNPDDYYATWRTNEARGARKGSITLWVYEKQEPKRKRYSVTTDAGGKIQPYFDVPSPGDPNLYIFTVIGEVIREGYVHAWVTERTKRDLENVLGTLSCEALSDAILKTMEGGMDHALLKEIMQSDEAATIVEVTEAAYDALRSSIEAANDELRFRALLVHLSQAGK